MKKMKTITSLMLITLLNFMIFSCGVSSKSSAKKENTRREIPVLPSPNEWIAVFKGSSSNKAQSCYLYIKNYDSSNGEQLVINALTLNTPKLFLLQQSQEQEDENLPTMTLEGKLATDHGAFEVLQVDLTLKGVVFAPTSYKQTYLHNDHFHSQVCQNLKLTSEYPNTDDYFDQSEDNEEDHEEENHDLEEHEHNEDKH